MHHDWIIVKTYGCGGAKEIPESKGFKRSLRNFGLSWTHQFF